MIYRAVKLVTTLHQNLGFSPHTPAPPGMAMYVYTLALQRLCCFFTHVFNTVLRHGHPHHRLFCRALCRLEIMMLSHSQAER